MANEDNQATEASWTIKSVPIEARKTAVRLAAKAGLTMGEWIAPVIEREARREAEDAVLPPMVPERSPGGGVPQAPPGSQVDAAGMQAMAAMLAALAQAAQAPEGQVPKAAVREGAALFREAARQARGLPPVARKANQANEGRRLIEGTAE